MKRLAHLLIYFSAILATGMSLVAAETESLDKQLEPLRPWIGKTWRSESKDAKTGKPVVDVARWERALNGKAIRTMHSINDGAYGGETLFTWDDSKKSLVYHYFTTAGFITQGTVTIKEGKLITHEVVKGEAGGITEVKGTSEMRADGVFQVKTEYLKNGEWIPGRNAEYKEDSNAKVIFK